MLLANIQKGDVSIQLITFFLAIYASGVVKGRDRMECSAIMRSLQRGSAAQVLNLSTEFPLLNDLLLLCEYAVPLDQLVMAELILWVG